MLLCPSLSVPSAWEFSGTCTHYAWSQIASKPPRRVGVLSGHRAVLTRSRHYRSELETFERAFDLLRLRGMPAGCGGSLGEMFIRSVFTVPI